MNDRESRTSSESCCSECASPAEREVFDKGPIGLCYCQMPQIKWKSILYAPKTGLFGKLLKASGRRQFMLLEDWEIELSRVHYKPRLNGKVVIRCPKNGGPASFDGASVPMPWLISSISGGLLRPLGAMLIASIVHDYAFRLGHLHMRDESSGLEERVDLERDETDRLFRDIIHTTSGSRFLANCAWLPVRLGWFFVKYNGERLGGKPPIKAIAVALLIGVGLPGLLTSVFGAIGAKLYFGIALGLVAAFNITLWVGRLVKGK